MTFLDQYLLKHALAPPARSRDLRHSVPVQIELRGVGNDVPVGMKTTDLRRGGCYVELMTTLPVGTCELHRLNECSVRRKGRVVTSHPASARASSSINSKATVEKLWLNT